MAALVEAGERREKSSPSWGFVSLSTPLNAHDIGALFELGLAVAASLLHLISQTGGVSSDRRLPLQNREVDGGPLLLSRN